jgi:hypothetical protein
MYRGILDIPIFRYFEEWSIGVVPAPISSFLEQKARPPTSWLPLRERGKYFADPFGVVNDGTLYILCEEFDYRTNKGRIVSIELTDWRSPSRPKVAIELPIHISYPYVFKHQGEIYCMPETHQAQEIALYRADEFPDKWTKVATLVREFPGLDATIFQYERRWWLASTAHGAQDKLFIWYAQDPLDQWSPHPSNPVKRDMMSVRPAGTPFVYDACLYRPAQDCSKRYGRRILLNKVSRLTPTEFEEYPAVVIEPYANELYPEGLHTVSSVGDITLIDGKRLRLI